MDEAKRESQVERELDEQKAILEKLEEIVKGLRQELVTVLRDEPPVTQGEGKEEAQQLVPIARRIRDNNCTATEVITSIEKIIELCEL